MWETEILGFKVQDILSDDDVVQDKSQSLKAVPWTSWDEWNFVRESLFSSSPISIASSLKRIWAWRSTRSIPVTIEVAASFVEIQQKDPFFRNDLSVSARLSEEMLTMLYCMAIMRFVNGVIEKTRKRNEISIAQAADLLGIARKLIDFRHEASHRDLPSLQVVRPASVEALEWLKSYYWEPQEKKFHTQINQTSSLRKEIKRRLHEVSVSLKAKQVAKSSSSHVNIKQHLYGRSKLLFHVAGKQSHSNATGSKKQVSKSLKNVVRLYSSFSEQVVYLLLEYLLNALDSSNLAEHLEDSQVVHNTENRQTAFDDWGSVVVKLSRIEPEILLRLTEAVLEKKETDNHQSLQNSTISRQNELLSRLLEWLIEHLKTSYAKKESAETKGSKTKKHLPKDIVLGLLQRCLSVSSPENNRLKRSAVTLAQLTGDGTLLNKLKKFALLEQLPSSEPNTVDSSSQTLLSQQELSLRQAEKNFELIRKRQMQSRNEKANFSEKGSKRRWIVVTEPWSSCPIGMIPHNLGFSGRLSILDNNDEDGEAVISSDGKEDCKVNPGKREAEIGIEKIDETPVKRLETEADYVMRDEKGDVSAEGVKGHMMIDGVWKEVGGHELCAIASAVRLLV